LPYAHIISQLLSERIGIFTIPGQETLVFHIVKVPTAYCTHEFTGLSNLCTFPIPLDVAVNQYWYSTQSDALFILPNASILSYAALQDDSVILLVHWYTLPVLPVNVENTLSQNSLTACMTQVYVDCEGILLQALAPFSMRLVSSQVPAR
jgi:hypothetical protein